MSENTTRGDFHKDLMGMWEEETDPVMGNKDKNQQKKRILNLTLDIICLLTGEDYIIMKKPGDGILQSCIDCMLEGSCRLHPPAMSHSSHSVIQKENDKRILDLISNIIHLLTGEVAIRCEDVSIYLTLEEWEYIKGNKTLYKKVMEENPQQIQSLGSKSKYKDDTKGDLESTICCKNKPNNLVCEEEKSASCDKVYQSDCSVLSLTKQIQETDTSTTVGCDINSRVSANYLSNEIKEVSAPCEEGNESDCSINTLTEQIQGTDTSTTIMGCNLNNSLSDNYISNGFKEKPALCDGGNQSDRSINTLSEQIQGTDASTIMEYNLNNSFSVNYISEGIKEESDSYEEDISDLKIITISEPIEEMDSSNPHMGYSVNNSYFSNYISNERNQSECSTDIFTEMMKNTEISTPNVNCGLDKRLTEMYANYSDYNSLTKTNLSIPRREGLHKCTECNKFFSCKRNLVRHQKYHTGEKPFSCSECGTKFMDRSTLKIHYRIHTGERPFSCVQCGKRFVRNAQLTAHLKVHARIKPFTCTECGKRFSRKSHLAAHLKVHERKKTFTCIECGMCFRNAAQLGEHNKTHTGENPLEMNQSQLTEHYRIHTEDSSVHVD